MTGASVRRVLELMSRETGLDLSGGRRDLAVEAITHLRRASGARNMEQFSVFIQRDHSLRKALVERLCVAEAAFFDEPGPFELLRAEARQRRARHMGLQVWSAGCGTGEEVYSAMIVLHEEGILDRSHLTGTELSDRVLDRARLALYDRWTIDACDEEQQAVYFEPVGDRYRLRSGYSQAVELRQENLMDGPTDGAFDVVLCRNVLLHLTEPARDAAGKALHDALVPGGMVVTAGSDPVMEHEGFDLARKAGCIVYRRLGADAHRGWQVPAGTGSVG